jgi:hypothetical protein
MGGHGLAAGDPIGRPESIPLVVDEFLAVLRAPGVAARLPRRAESDLPLYASAGCVTSTSATKRSSTAADSLDHPEARSVSPSGTGSIARTRSALSEATATRT